MFNVENTGGKYKALAIKVIQIEVLHRSQRYETTLSDSDDSDGARPWGSGAQELPVSLGSVAGLSHPCPSGTGRQGSRSPLRPARERPKATLRAGRKASFVIIRLLTMTMKVL